MKNGITSILTFSVTMIMVALASTMSPEVAREGPQVLCLGSDASPSLVEENVDVPDSGTRTEASSIAPMTAAPTSPKALKAIPGDSSITLTWEAPANEHGSTVTNYSVYRGLTPGKESFLVTITGALNFTDVGLTNGQTYYYITTAWNEAGESPSSNEALATPRSVPSAPLDLVATAGDCQVELVWAPPTDDGGAEIIAYKIFRGTSSNDLLPLTTIGNVLSYTDTGLSNEQTYYYSICSINYIGERAFSVEASATPGSVPSPPQGLNVFVGNSYVDLNWTAPDYVGHGSLAYHLFRDGSLIWSGTGQTHTDDGLVNGVIYSYTVAAENTMGWGANCAEVNAMPEPKDTLPTCPEGLTAVAGLMSIDLSWDGPSYPGSGDVTFRLFRDDVLIWSGTVCSYQDSPLAKGQAYSYNVAAQNSIGWGQNSSMVTATPYGVPDAPWALQAFPGDAEILLIWNDANYSGPGNLTYHLFRDGELVWNGGATAYNEVGLMNGRAYGFSVAASNAAGWGSNSSSIQASPQGLPSACRGLDAVEGDGYVLLNWTAPEYLGPGTTVYHLFRDGSMIWSGTAQYFNDSAVENDVEYSYRVAAQNDLGWGPNASSVLATPSVILIPPGVPAGLHIEIGDSQVTLNWNVPVQSGNSPITGYKLYRGSDNTSLSSLAIVTGTTYVDAGVVDGETYFYKVSAINSAGEGQPTEAAMVTFLLSSIPQDSTWIVVMGIVGVAAIVGSGWLFIWRPSIILSLLMKGK